MTFREKQEKINEGLAKIAVEQMETEGEIVKLRRKLRELNQQLAMLYRERESLVND